MLELDRIISGDCLEVLSTLPEDSIDAIVTDPPAGIAFMGKEWDQDKGGRDEWIGWMAQVASECLRVIKPGGHALVWALPRTSHWTGMAWEEAGWEPRDKISHVFGSGFPKSLDISKKIDQMFPRMEMFDEFAKHFSECRSAKGLSQKEIAVNFPSKTGGLTGCVWNWENGANVPTLAQWEILQPILGLSDEFRPLIERIEAERETIGVKPWTTPVNGFLPDGRDKSERKILDITAPATPAAKQWAGWGSAIKPAHEDWWLFRKPLAEKTIAENVLRWGCGGINIDGCRVGTRTENESGWSKTGSKASENRSMTGVNYERAPKDEIGLGRFPANLIWSHSPNCKRIGTKKVKGIRGGNSTNIGGFVTKYADESKRGVSCGYTDADGLEEVESWDCDPSCPSWQFAKAGERKSGKGIKTKSGSLIGNGNTHGKQISSYDNPGIGGDSGSAARFFQSCPFTEEDIPAFLYYAKASRAERERGLDGMAEAVSHSAYGEYKGTPEHGPNTNGHAKNFHPTVKPLSLMRYLCRLITPPGGLILDPFAGSGTTCMAAKAEGFHYIGIEREAEYVEIARRRIAAIPTSLSRWVEDARPC